MLDLIHSLQPIKWKTLCSKCTSNGLPFESSEVRCRFCVDFCFCGWLMLINDVPRMLSKEEYGCSIMVRRGGDLWFGWKCSVEAALISTVLFQASGYPFDEGSCFWMIICAAPLGEPLDLPTGSRRITSRLFIGGALMTRTSFASFTLLQNRRWPTATRFRWISWALVRGRCCSSLFENSSASRGFTGGDSALEAECESLQLSSVHKCL